MKSVTHKQNTAKKNRRIINTINNARNIHESSLIGEKNRYYLLKNVAVEEEGEKVSGVLERETADTERNIREERKRTKINIM